MRKGGRRPGAGRKPGIPNKATGEARELAQQWGPEAIKQAARLAGLVKGKNGVPIGQAESEQARISAIGIILDRAYGKAPQPQTGEDGEGPVKAVLEVVWGGMSGSNGQGS